MRFGPSLSRTVKALILANCGVFVVQLMLYMGPPGSLLRFERLFALTPELAIEGLRVWQFVSYSFLHEVAGPLPLHIIFNMLMLWMFGRDVEQTVGRPRFLKLYFGSVIAGGVCMIPWYGGMIVGASGAVFGVMALFARLFPERRVYVWGVLPVRARTLALVLVGVELLLLVSVGPRSNVAHLAHVGGFVVGWFFLRMEGVAEARWSRRRFRREIEREEEDAEIRARVDDLLAKVGREGLGSLTRRERAFLKQASRRFRR